MKVTLLQNHTHAGVDYAAGAEIDVPETDAAWLVANNVVGIGQRHDPEAAPIPVEEAAERAGKGRR